MTAEHPRADKVLAGPTVPAQRLAPESAEPESVELQSVEAQLVEAQSVVAPYPERLVLRGRSAYSATLWSVWLLAAVVAAGDVTAGVLWLVRGRPTAPVYVFAAVVLALATLLLAGTTYATAAGVRGQRYALSGTGIEVGRLTVDWPEVVAIGRAYGSGTMGVAVFVADPARFARVRHADEHFEEHGTPLFLDLTETSGGTIRFYAAARWYTGQAGHTGVEFR